MAWTSLYYHIVFAIRDRRPLLRDCLPRACQYASGILKNLDSHVIAAGGAEDHMHLAVELHATRPSRKWFA